MTFRNLTALVLLFAAVPALAIGVPVNDLSLWRPLAFNNIAPNRVSIDDGALRIAVRGSASPLIYSFDEPVLLTGINVAASWEGELKIPPGAAQGDENADDFVLKFGVVEAGEQTLNWLQRRLAADWIKQLYKLAPRGSGIKRINFLSTTQQRELLGSARVHPLNDLLHEQRITLLDGPGAIEMSYRYDEPVMALGLWISSDGDDTGSAFVLTIFEITLQMEPLSKD